MIWTPRASGVPSFHGGRELAVERLLGVEIGGEQLRWALVTGGRTEATGSWENPRTGSRYVMDAVTRITREHLPDHLGVAVPGLVNRDTGVSRLTANVPGPWIGFPVRDELANRVACPVSIMNDGRAFGQGELLLGAAKGLRNVVFLMLHGRGVGGAYAFSGRILADTDDRLGEFGHLTVEPDGERCQACEGRGCLETFAMGQAIVRRYRARSGAGAPDAAAVAQAAADGDPCAVEVLAECGRAVGIALNNLVGILPAQAIVLGGGIAAEVLPWMDAEIAARLSERRRHIGEVGVLRAVLGVWAPAVGAALTGPARKAPG